MRYTYAQGIANSNGYQVVQEFVGHGTGVYLHMPPYVAHHTNNDKLALRTGMVFTIEPILVEGSRDVTVWAEDGWTVVTKDEKR